jgi:hypothetical protein
MENTVILYVTALFLGVHGGDGWAGDAVTAKTIPLHYGSNDVHFGNDDESGMAVLARRENFNAHGFDVLTLYLKPAKTEGYGHEWQLLSVFDGGKEALTLTASGGADCLLQDFRLVRHGAGDVTLIVAERDLGSSYADAATVRFKFYALRRNSAGNVGYPLAYFELSNSSVAKKPYCDVGDAFQNELGIGPYRQ